jgi:hypothetical protein
MRHSGWLTARFSDTYNPSLVDRCNAAAISRTKPVAWPACWPKTGSPSAMFLP